VEKRTPFMAFLHDGTRCRAGLKGVRCGSKVTRCQQGVTVRPQRVIVNYKE